MRSIKISIILIGFAIALILAEQVTAQYVIKQGVLGNGGTALSNSGHRLVGTAGQPGIGIVSSPSHINEAGFWYQAGKIVTSIEPASNFLPIEFILEQNYPNPFNPSTTVEFALPKSAFVTLKIYNLLGEEVATLIAEQREAGIHQLNWDAKGLTSGVYLYRLEAGDPSTGFPNKSGQAGQVFGQVKKLILMR